MAGQQFSFCTLKLFTVFWLVKRAICTATNFTSRYHTILDILIFSPNEASCTNRSMNGRKGVTLAHVAHGFTTAAEQLVSSKFPNGFTKIYGFPSFLRIIHSKMKRFGYRLYFKVSTNIKGIWFSGITLL